MKKSELLTKVLKGDVRASARLMRIADDRADGCAEYMRHIWKHTGNALIIGITGAPGAGKSTLTDTLITAYRKMGKKVGVVAVDPSSPFSGGAILGDRIRMSAHSTDKDVFIRSVATRGSLGGLSASVMDIAAVMDAMGKDIIIIETVGVGQDEVEIAAVADVCIVVTIPGMGDDIQAIKAGILEVGDIFAVNKADRDGVERTVKDLEMMLEFVSKKAPVLKTIAVKGEGVSELAEAAVTFPVNKDKREARMMYTARTMLKERVFERFFPDKALSLALKDSDNDPYDAVSLLWKKVFGDKL